MFAPRDQQSLQVHSNSAHSIAMVLRSTPTSTLRWLPKRLKRYRIILWSSLTVLLEVNHRFWYRSKVPSPFFSKIPWLWRSRQMTWRNNWQWLTSHAKVQNSLLMTHLIVSFPALILLWLKSSSIQSTRLDLIPGFNSKLRKLQTPPQPSLQSPSTCK